MVLRIINILLVGFDHDILVAKKFRNSYLILMLYGRNLKNKQLILFLFINPESITQNSYEMKYKIFVTKMVAVRPISFFSHGLYNCFVFI